MSYLFSSSPWKIVKDEDGSINVVSGIETVASVYATNEEYYSEFTQEANANLIANAPEMYQLLEAIQIIGNHSPDKLPELLNRIKVLFLKLGVTTTQYRLKQEMLAKQEVMLDLAHKELEAEMQREEEATILQKYFGDRWEEYEIHSADVGYHIVSKKYARAPLANCYLDLKYFNEEYFLLDNKGKEDIKPCYFSYATWTDGNEIAYVYQDPDSDKVLVSIDEAFGYSYNDIIDVFCKHNIEEPDMDKVATLIRGQSVEELIKDYKKDYHHV